MNGEPQSKLTMNRPDIWIRALSLATNLTGYIYAPKLPAADGSIWACGGLLPEPTPREKIKELEEKIKINERYRKHPGRPWRDEYLDECNKEYQKEIDRLKKEFNLAPTVYVPEGAMEWLLHEVGHYIAATPEERLLPNYGYGTIKKKGWGKARELQAWGFEEIILSPFGTARMFAPPEHRGGTAFEKSGPIPEMATRHAQQQMLTLGIDAEQWRVLYGEWVEWVAIHERGREEKG
jgi:hypothetical protein